MYKLFGVVALCVSLVGCATPAQNAALAGALVGASIGAAVANPPPPQRRQCYTTSYYDGYGNLIRRTTCY